MNQYVVLTVPKVTVLSMSPQPVSVSYTCFFCSLPAVGVVHEFCLWPRLNLRFLHNKDPYSVPAWPCFPSSFPLHHQVDTLPTLCSEVAHIVASDRGILPFHSPVAWGSRPRRPLSADRFSCTVPSAPQTFRSHVPLLSLSHR